MLYAREFNYSGNVFLFFGCIALAGCKGEPVSSSSLAAEPLRVAQARVALPQMHQRGRESGQRLVGGIPVQPCHRLSWQ